MVTDKQKIIEKINQLMNTDKPVPKPKEDKEHDADNELLSDLIAKARKEAYDKEKELQEKKKQSA